MNRENIDRVIASVLDERRPFNADDQFVCIRGHCYMVDGREAPLAFEYEHMAAFLGIEKRDAARLFYSDLVAVFPDPQVVTRRQAATVLRHLRDTGEVSWQAALAA